MSVLPAFPLHALPDICLDDAAAPGAPAWIGKYRVLHKLGEGATSEVFLAEDSFNRQQVAIKRALPMSAIAPGDERYHERFFAAEADLVGRLKHPNVVQILDAVAEEPPYLVMEHVPGGTLKPFCRPDALLSLENIVEIGFKCARALGYVARLGLIHRDVKPANILVVKHQDSVADIKLTDFGSSFNRRSDRTQVFRVGSLAYMSPEQLDGGVLDARADMHSLGAVLYHLITGRPPFDAPHAAALMHQICHAEAPPPSRLRKGVPPRMDALITRLLAKRPEDRPPDWDSFAREWALLVANAEVPMAGAQQVRDSERFNLLRALDFFSAFGEVELWEVVHRARWLRHPHGTALYRRGDTDRSFHIIAQGRVDVYREGVRVARLGPGTSVGEMVYLAPSPDLKVHAADVIVSQPGTTTVGFTPEQMEVYGPSTRHLFDAAFIRVLVRRLHAAHEALSHPRRIL